MAQNRFFAINLDDPNMTQIQAVIVDPVAKPRCSLDETLFAAALFDGDNNVYEFLAQYQEYNHQQFLALMRSPEWQPPIE